MRVNKMEEEDMRKWKSYWHWLYYATKSYLSSERFKDTISTVLAYCYLIVILGAIAFPLWSMLLLFNVFVRGAPVTFNDRVIIAGALLCPSFATYTWYKLSRRKTLSAKRL